MADEVLSLIPEICDTCKICRQWSKPLPGNVCAVDLPDEFNKQVECDLLFVHKFIIFHLLDRCTRWHATLVVNDREEETLTFALDSVWVKIHGPMKFLIIDCESGITLSELAKLVTRTSGDKASKSDHEQKISTPATSNVADRCIEIRSTEWKPSWRLKASKCPLL